jgi:hypothetical protein
MTHRLSAFRLTVKRAGALVAGQLRVFGMSRGIVISVACLLLAAGLVGVVGAGAGLGEELVVNGGAESSAGALPQNGQPVIAPEGWQTTGSLTAIQYGGDGTYLQAGQGAPDGGSNYFAGGPGGAVSTATQTVSLSRDAAAIDTGTTTATLSAWLGGWSSQEDSATVQATFLKASGTATKGLKIGPVTAGQRRGETKLLPRMAKTLVPSGTRSIKIEIVATRATGVYNDGYADDISLVLASGKPLTSLQLNLYKKRFTPATAYRASCPASNECVIADGALVTICNNDDFRHEPFAISQPNAFGAWHGHVWLNPGQCFKKRFRNTSNGPIQVKIYDEIHPQERFILTVLPHP